MKQMEVTIMGQSYLLGCPEGGEAALAKAVSQVDREMSAIRDSGRVKARERIAVLAALNLAYQLAEGGASAANAQAKSRPLAADNLPDLESLMRRLDEALEHDGKLL
ncbi:MULTISPECIES: cell division protein ZapA [Roseateles]|uniref:Cell division protein ZapA n=1 Tax=Roseateles albus TaxID=2987525 RepID=A0ABT5KLM9_9BURK|nr:MULTISPECIES: cell division protein ZapA [Roseateles]MCV2361030.1 cell division protein ZapA [Paucibacter sp. TC2R-5]MDC8774317.1 cell division protein ZapA [Roseateles albus]